MPYYDWVKMKEMAIEATEKHKLLFMTEVVCYLPCTYSAFFNNKMNEDEDILQALADNRVKIKVKIRKRWEDSENVTAEIMLYKLTADEEELRRLSVTKSEVTGEAGGPIKTENMNFSKLSTDDLKKLEELAKLAGDSEGTE
jgi:hypothetical protein